MLIVMYLWTHTYTEQLTYTLSIHVHTFAQAQNLLAVYKNKKTKLHVYSEYK